MSQKKIPSYENLGVSSQKEDVHSALKNIDKGLFPSAFCKIIEDIALDNEFCSILHADGAGTKSTLAYMMYQETKDLSYFKGIVQDSVIMNLDDIICVGKPTSILLSNTIGRNKKIISGEIIAKIIQSYEEYVKKLRDHGIPIYTGGGETADVGDLVRTLIVDSTLITRMKRKDVINPKTIREGDVIVGLSSFGKTSYENIEYNSGIGSNGLTLARHGLLNHKYYEKYPECFAPEIDKEFVFFGKHDLNDKVPDTPLSVGEALLSPTRTFAPILMEIFKEDYRKIHAIFHNTGGGQTKCLKFGHEIHYIKDNLFPIPPLFSMIQESSKTPWDEMYRVFNMGNLLEIICTKEYAKNIIIPMARKFSVDARIIGRLEKSNVQNENQLTITSTVGKFKY
ncbi:AIR synthase related protein [Promethearchaeum syntrophicum]|uniref:phosphoribosylformylglycinamidine cyclo-ligase n=1 Tax=Promethearchaeum syntrophicum TaxID=2594042 RepID=A0A5B9DA47_9ARCH|nr:AIR synthase related protein [Candidatus Prometheoarchaeum syntrophicum]QEE15717.1 phosphoribosylaminoimidazole synthetase [Candidatus Prometheoarchaeum syntrophicum]